MTAIKRVKPFDLTFPIYSVNVMSPHGCDGIVMATPTGSTAYSFSAGGPVVWPEVEAMLVVPISAHALFAKPLVVSPKSVVELVVTTGPVEVSCDRRRKTELATGATIRPVQRHPGAAPHRGREDSFLG